MKLSKLSEAECLKVLNELDAAYQTLNLGAINNIVDAFPDIVWEGQDFMCPEGSIRCTYAEVFLKKRWYHLLPACYANDVGIDEMIFAAGSFRFSLLGMALNSGDDGGPSQPLIALALAADANPNIEYCTAAFRQSSPLYVVLHEIEKTFIEATKVSFTDQAQEEDWQIAYRWRIINYCELAHMLLSAGAHPNYPNCFPKPPGPAIINKLVSHAWNEGAKVEATKLLKRMLDCGGDVNLIQVDDPMGLTPLETAVVAKNVDAIEILYRAGATWRTQADGRTLMQALEGLPACENIIADLLRQSLDISSPQKAPPSSQIKRRAPVL